MIPILFKIGPFSVYSYGFMAAMGFLVTGFLLKRELKRTGFPDNMSDSIVLGAMVGGILGAKIYSAIQGGFGLFWTNFLSGMGLVWYGGFAGGVIAVMIIIQYYHASVLKIFDNIAPLLILGYAFGRMGCFLSGDGDYGPPTDLPWGMSFPDGIVPTFDKVHPTPLYEIILSLLIFAFLWRIRKSKTQTGWMFGMYLISGGAERFISEFWRRPEGRTMAQIISLLVITVGIGLVLRARKTQIEIKPDTQGHQARTNLSKTSTTRTRIKKGQRKREVHNLRKRR